VEENEGDSNGGVSHFKAAFIKIISLSKTSQPAETDSIY